METDDALWIVVREDNGEVRTASSEAGARAYARYLAGDNPEVGFAVFRRTYDTRMRSRDHK